ncbi:MAG: 16S rRNA (cytidine(1402)-2'-O)-methyltransferase [Atopobiaceae bacterium]|jgi:16S rRNA (cytidine1402-2'-O)-methyltransferase
MKQLHTSTQGLLSMVGTPIGNLGDVSERVRKTLAAADLILCEDTRVTAKLLSCLDIHVPLKRCDENVIAERIDESLDLLSAGVHIAFVSDAGMPGVSDPGQRLVDAALDEHIKVEVIPGPSAVICALVASGLGMDHFFFEGFLPRKAGERTRRLQELIRIPGALVFYESPHRILDTLTSIAECMPQRRVALVRELTKIHEQCVRGYASELIDALQGKELRGECVIVVEGPSQDEIKAAAREAMLHDLMTTAQESAGADTAGEGAQPSDETLSLDSAIRAALTSHESKTKIAKRLSRAFDCSRQEIYLRIVEISEEESSS